MTLERGSVTLSGQLQLRELKLAAGQEWFHQSEAWRVVLLCSGAAYWLGTDKSRAISEGEMIVIAPKVKALIRTGQLGDALLSWFTFDPSLVCGLFTLTERLWFERATHSADAPVQFLPSTHPIPQALRVLLQQGQTTPDIVRRSEVLVLVLRLLAGSMPSESLIVGRSAAAHDRFRQIVAQMPETEFTQHTSEELAALCGCTPRHFNRLFRAQFGQPPRVRQNELRLLKARSLLETSEQTVAQIAVEWGYRTLSLFVSLFRRRFGFSPSEWRQKSQAPFP